MTTTIADHLDDFLNDMQHVARLRLHTVRAYRYELVAAAKQLTASLHLISLADLEQWVNRGGASASSVGRRTAALSRFFSWAKRHHLCTNNPLDGREPLRTKRQLPRPIRGPNLSSKANGWRSCSGHSGTATHARLMFRFK